MANIPAILAYDVPGTEDVGSPTKFRLNVGPAVQPIACSMPFCDAGPTPLYTLRKHVAFNQCDCTVFSDCCIMPDDTLYWPNSDVMLYHRLRR